MKRREHTDRTVMFPRDDEVDEEVDENDLQQPEVEVEEDLVRCPLMLLLFSPKRGNMVETEDE
jgi:hypothetical protein